MVQRWQWDHPFSKFEKPVVVAEGVRFNSRNEPMTPAHPPEYFGNMSIMHRKKLVEKLSDPKGIEHSRFAHDLPSFDRSTLGQKMSKTKFDQVFGGSMATLLNAICLGRQGELLQFDGGWVSLPSGFPESHTHSKGHWHCQYAKTVGQRQRMRGMNLPGTQYAKMRAQEGWQVMGQADLMRIGDTTVCRIGRNGIPMQMREAKVVTWPQLFLLGIAHDFTAHEVFAAGWQLERIMTERERPWCNDAKTAHRVMIQSHQSSQRGESSSREQSWKSESSWDSSWAGWHSSW